MGTTINGLYTGGKTERRKRALKRLEENDLKYYQNKVDTLFNELHEKKMSDSDYEYTRERFNNATNQVKRVVRTIDILKSRIYNL
jgi:5-bromo-4-chloroindolyl phosphate hydrolysis protein